MVTQACPNCGRAQDVGVFVSGQRVACQACGLGFDVVRSDIPAPRPRSSSAISPPVSAPTAAAPAAPAASPPAAALTAAVSPAPAAEPSSSDPTVVRSALKLPGYEIEHLLGRGGMGEVWRARQLSLGRLVAVKVLSAELARNPEFVRRFEKEAAALAALSHPHIVQIIDRGQVNDTYYFAMELVDGDSLRVKMDAARISAGEALRIVSQVSRAIDYAHQQGVIHRDLKPENILLDADGRVKVADFGLAGMRDEKFNVTRTAMTMGTLNYMAPEQRKDARSVDGRADLYSIGVMLYELLTGEVPVGRFKLPSELIRDLDPRVDKVVARSLETEPAARYQQANEIVRDLESMLSTLNVPAAALAAAHPPHPSSEIAAAHSSVAESVVKGAGHLAQKVVMGVLLFLGLGVVMSLMGVDLYLVDDRGFHIGRYTVPLAGRPDGGLRALPDTNGDVGVASRFTAGESASMRSPLTPGTDSSLIAFQGQWSANAQGLEARVFGRYQDEGSRPRATLEEPSWNLSNLSAEVKVKVDPTPPPGFAPRHPPRATLLFHGRDLMLQLVMELGDAAAYRVVWKYVDAAGKTRIETAGDPDFEDLRPEPGVPVVLRLVGKDGQLSVFANGQAVLGRPVRLPPLLTRDIGRVGVSCEEATCNFSELSVDGLALENQDLGDDVHQHTLAALPTP